MTLTQQLMDSVAVTEATAAANKWVSHAAPIIRAYLAMQNVDMVSAICENHYGKDSDSKARTRDYREANGYIENASAELYYMLDGIRDNYRCDYVRSASMDADDAEWDAVEAFNDELDRGLITVEAAIKAVEDGL